MANPDSRLILILAAIPAFESSLASPGRIAVTVTYRVNEVKTSHKKEYKYLNEQRAACLCAYDSIVFMGSFFLSGLYSGPNKP